MQPPTNGVARLEQAERRPTLTELLTRYPRLNVPQLSNVSTRHMASMAKRANTTSASQSVLRDYLAGQ